MYTPLLHTHSLFRYIFLALIIIAIVKSFNGWLNKKPFLPGDKKAGLFTLITAHLQLVIGLILYFVSPNVKTGLADMGAAMKDPGLRFWTVEHLIMMIIAVFLITLGYSLSKRGKSDEARHKQIAIFYLLALVVIFLAIPWPWSAVSRGWMPGM